MIWMLVKTKSILRNLIGDFTTGCNQIRWLGQDMLKFERNKPLFRRWKTIVGEMMDKEQQFITPNLSVVKRWISIVDCEGDVECIRMADDIEVMSQQMKCLSQFHAAFLPCRVS